MAVAARNRYVPEYTSYDSLRDARQSAERRARKLFRAHLNQRQLATLKNGQWVYVRGNHTGRLYRVDCTRFTNNIFSRGESFCVIMWDHSVPRYDHLLAQKLLIETNERKFLKIAVRS